MKLGKFLPHAVIYWNSFNGGKKKISTENLKWQLDQKSKHLKYL